MENPKPGMVVQLKSGGPKMTIAEVNPKFGARCIWFLEGKQEGKFFKPETLDLFEEEKNDK